jgi:hypothetical protein
MLIRPDGRVACYPDTGRPMLVTRTQQLEAVPSPFPV